MTSMQANENATKTPSPLICPAHENKYVGVQSGVQNITLWMPSLHVSCVVPASGVVGCLPVHWSKPGAHLWSQWASWNYHYTLCMLQEATKSACVWRWSV